MNDEVLFVDPVHNVEVVWSVGWRSLVVDVDVALDPFVGPSGDFENLAETVKLSLSEQKCFLAIFPDGLLKGDKKDRVAMTELGFVIFLCEELAVIFREANGPRSGIRSRKIGQSLAIN